ncbi:MAG: hypothetical protein ACT4UP_00100 [Gammaproteobacteria bacterium]
MKHADDSAIAVALRERRRDLAPSVERTFREFGRHVFTDGALRHGVTDREIMEAIRAAAKMQTGATFAHASIAMAELD